MDLARRMTPQERYNKKNTRMFCLRLSKKYDQDIIQILDEQPIETGGKQGYIKRLIRADAKKREL